VEVLCQPVILEARTRLGHGSGSHHHDHLRHTFWELCGSHVRAGGRHDLRFLVLSLRLARPGELSLLCTGGARRSPVMTAMEIKPVAAPIRSHTITKIGLRKLYSAVQRLRLSY